MSLPKQRVIGVEEQTKILFTKGFILCMVWAGHMNNHVCNKNATKKKKKKKVVGLELAIIQKTGFLHSCVHIMPGQYVATHVYKVSRRANYCTSGVWLKK